MRSGATRFTILAAITGISALVFCNSGCEKLESQERQSERTVDQVARQALQKEQAQRPEMYARAADEVIGKSDVATARARQLQALAEYNAGTALLQKANNQAADLSLRIADINHLLTTIETSNSLVAGYSHYDSRPIRQAADKQIAEIEGSADQLAWVPGKNPVLNLHSVKQSISKLQDQIDQKQNQINALAKQRVEDLRKAEDISERADKATGKAWVDLYKQASDLRKKAADISTHIGVIDSEIQPLKVELAIAQDNQKAADTAITGVKQQAQGAEEAFAAVRHAASDHHAVVQSVYENQSNTTQPSENPQSLKAKIDALIDQVKTVQTTWDAADKLLADSAEHFQAAQSAAESLQVKLDQRSIALPSDSPEKHAWDQLKSVYNPTLYQFHRAVALQAQGTMAGDQLAILEQLERFKKLATTTLRRARLPVPQSLESARFAEQIREMRRTGHQAFTQADDLFQNVANAPLASAGQRNSARAARVIELYAWYKFAEVSDNAQASAHLTAARDAIKDAMENNATLPILPAELQPPVASPATAPTTNPAVATTAPTPVPAH